MVFLMAVLPILYMIFLWWFSTGMIMAVYGRRQNLTRLFFLLYSLAAAAAFGGLWLSRDQGNVESVYIAITCANVIWGWHVTGYYLGFVSGPRDSHEALAQMKSVHELGLRDRFVLAFRASLHHELLAVGTGVLICGLVWGQANQWALWFYLTLWLMHGSARLNVFLGVRNFNIEFLPREMHYLKHAISLSKFNMFFPASMVLAGTAVMVLIYQAILPGVSYAYSTGAAMVATIIVLGILEHGLLVLPLPVMLWGWGLRSIEPSQNQTQKKIYESGD